MSGGVGEVVPDDYFPPADTEGSYNGMYWMHHLSQRVGAFVFSVIVPNSDGIDLAEPLGGESATGGFDAVVDNVVAGAAALWDAVASVLVHIVQSNPQEQVTSTCCVLVGLALVLWVGVALVKWRYRSYTSELRYLQMRYPHSDD